MVSETDQVPQIKTYKREEKHRHNYLCGKIQTVEISVLKAEGVHRMFSYWEDLVFFRLKA